VIRSREEVRFKPARAILGMLNTHASLRFFDNDAVAHADYLAAKDAFLGGNEEVGGFAGELVALCKITVEKGKDLSQDKKRVYTMSKDCRTLVRVIRDAQNQVLMPVEPMLVPSLPRNGKTDHKHAPFPTEEVYIQGLDERIDVMQSMMSPVKVIFKGSDGKEYKFLAKPKDDLRKDTRMMEFNTMINRLLLKDADARRRNLHLRTFTVIPMNESTGIIEWVDNTEVFRSIVDKQVVKLMHKSFHGTTYARKLPMGQPEGALTLDSYNHLISTYIPVFYKWFQETFSDPAAWTAARNTYVRTMGAWSMVGYVVGLGDRHTENILFDSTTGACVHVDFACMFNKGETLKIPERVPFRLTHNMVDAMGVAGCGGAYETTCCNTMCVLRSNRDALMNVLETCVHDPLTEFVRKGDDARDRLHRCERRLFGQVTRYASPPRRPGDRDIRQVLSVEGQVESVIAEAVSPNNLHQMYRWWMAWY
jgi:serine/threonine-protein kinase ATR